MKRQTRPLPMSLQGRGSLNRRQRVNTQVSGMSGHCCALVPFRCLAVVHSVLCVHPVSVAGPIFSKHKTTEEVTLLPWKPTHEVGSRLLADAPVPDGFRQPLPHVSVDAWYKGHASFIGQTTTQRQSNRRHSGRASREKSSTVPSAE